LGVVTRSENTTIAREHRRLFDDGRTQQVGVFVVLAEFGRQFVEARRVERAEYAAQFRQQTEAVAQGRQVTRACAAQGDAGEDAFEVAERAELRAQVVAGRGFGEDVYGVMAQAQRRAI